MILTGFKKWFWLAVLTLVYSIVLWIRSPAIAQTPRPENKLTFPPLAEVVIPPYQRYQLSNGMIVYLMEDHRLPRITGSAILRTGSVLEPATKIGLAGITGQLMRSGGTQNHPANELNRLLENNAASVESSIGIDSGTVSFTTLTPDLENVFKLFVEVLRVPAFETGQFELIKTQLKGHIARRNDNPGEIASREFRKLVYGPTSPYSRTIENETIDNITREDVLEFYSHVGPGQIILGIVGDFKPDQIKGLIESNLADWSNKSTPLTFPKTEITQTNQGQVYTINQSQLNQSNVLLGQLGGRIDSPDYPSLSVLNGVLSGFGGRLFNEIRSRQGLAYSVSGIWRANYTYPGIFIAGGQTRSSETVPFIKALNSEIERIRTIPITPEELSYSKDSILNSFVFNFTSPRAILSRVINYEYFNYPCDFIFRYQKAVKEVTIEDVKRVAKEQIRPEKMVTLIVGNTQKIDPPLDSLGKIVGKLQLKP